ncbi:MAG TPA: HAD family phosphatase [Myxococcales bacterium]|jgi:HAD superfamily hydrolase (TIGR01509 family)
MRAVIFDLDGTLVDNMCFHAEAWVETTRRLGCERPQEFFETATAGKKGVEILRMLMGPSVPEADLVRHHDAKEALYRERFAPNLAPVPGAVELLERLAAAEIPCGLATCAPKANRDMVLDGLDLRVFFKTIVGAEQALRGKPHPDIFLACAKAMGIEPAECVAFEDAINGVQSAVAAGIPTVAVTTANSPEVLKQAGAKWIVANFHELPADLETALFG